MKKTYSSRSNVLLMEIIIALLFFSVSSAVCIQIFVKSHTLSDDSKALDFAVTQSSSIAELVKNNENVEDALLANYQKTYSEDGKYILFFDDSYKACEKDDYYYRISIAPTDNSEMVPTYTITVNTRKSLSPLYELTVVSYQQARRSANSQ